MTVVVKVNFVVEAVRPDDIFRADMASWLEPYYTAGNTPNPYPDIVTNLSLFRIWDTVENAQAYVDKITTYNCVVSAVIEQ